MTRHTPQPWITCGQPAPPKKPAAPRAQTKRLLVIGATGVFGGRFAEHIVNDHRFRLILASRELARATKAAATLSAQAGRRVEAVALQPGRTFARDMARLAPWGVINCAGPFRAGGIEIASAALDAGAHYVDIADSPAYLRGFRDALNRRARAARLSAVAGASSTPALSAAVAADLTQDLRSVEAITLAIAPGGQGAVGTAVIQGILGYAGAGIPAWRDGTLQSVTGWLGASRLQIGPLPPRRAVPVETFDAELLGPRHRVSGEVTFRAALESRVEQIAVEFLARGRQRGWFANLPRLAPALARLRGLTRLGLSDRGGMQVSVAGRDAAGARVRRDWSLVAERGHGPYVPILPAAAAIKAIAENRIGRGAKLASDALTLEEIEREMRRYSLSVSPRHGLGP